MFSETKVKDIDWKAHEDDLSKLSKDQLIAFVLKKSARGKRDLEKKIAIEKRENVCVDSYISFLNSVIPSSFVDAENPEKTRRDKGMKYFKENEAKKKQIKILKDEKKKVEEKIANVRKPKQECHQKKKEAQNKITPKSVKSTYKYFEKYSEPVPVALFEIFIGCLRGIPKASKEDVELYLRNHKGLITSMNKLDEAKVNRENAKHYADVLKEIKRDVVEKEYARFIPYYVWMDNVIRIIKCAIEEKHLREELQQKEDSIFKQEHDIQRNQIILDHLGIDPHEHEHMTSLVEFWQRHVQEVTKHLNNHEKVLSTWEEDHVVSVRESSKKHAEEEKKVDQQKRDYPVFGQTDKKEAVEDKKKDKKASDSESESGSDEGDDEEAEDSDSDERSESERSNAV